MNLNPVFLDNSRGLIASPGDLNACLNSRGLYNSFQFVLRLSPVVHNKLASIPTGVVSSLDPEESQAYSTYLHETIHWWQHIGSTTGMMLSLSYPGQTHANYQHLLDYIKTVGPKKSILEIGDVLTRIGIKNEAHDLSNTIVNNHFDIEFFRILSTTPRLVNDVLANPFFECIGHSFATAYGNILQILTDTLEQADGVLSDSSAWQGAFARLRSEKRKGFYHGSEIMVSPVGAYELFEGQARFSQLQFLFFSSGKSLSWDDFRSRGMLEGIYLEAFDGFLKLACLDWPATPDDPIIGLFLLVCDIAINPGVGFPFQVRVFETFVDDLDPGMRFLLLCLEIKKQPLFSKKIRNYSRDEYIEVSEELTRALYFHSPLAVAEEAAGLIFKSEKVQSLMLEHQTFEYSKVNLPVRVIFSHFLSFCQDKVAKPEFFCWPGAWCTGDRVSNENLEVFIKHSALFRDKEHDDGIFPHIPPGKNPLHVQEMFNTFYTSNVVYDMTRQWISRPGTFDYDYCWLSTNQSFNSKTYAENAFKSAFKVHPNEFVIV